MTIESHGAATAVSAPLNQIREPFERPRWISTESVSTLQHTQMVRGTVGWLVCSAGRPGAAATATPTRRSSHHWTCRRKHPPTNFLWPWQRHRKQRTAATPRPVCVRMFECLCGFVSVFGVSSSKSKAEKSNSTMLIYDIL